MLRNVGKNLVHNFSRIIPLRVYPFLIRREVLAVFYHAVSDEALNHVRHLYPVVSTSKFKQDIEFLRERYEFIGYEELHAHRTKGAELPPQAVHLSFDDGYVECFSVVRPILMELGIPCTFFITTDFVDSRDMYYRNKVSLCLQRVFEMSEVELEAFFYRLKQSLGESLEGLMDFLKWIKALGYDDQTTVDRVCQVLGVEVDTYLQKHQPYLSGEQIRRLHAEGFTIGAHSKTHRKFNGLSLDDIESEIVISCNVIQEITAQEVIPFSFPHSAWGVDRVSLANIRKRNPQVGLMFDTKGLREDMSFILNRVWAERELDSGMGSVPISRAVKVAYRDQMEEAVYSWGRRLVKGE